MAIERGTPQGCGPLTLSGVVSPRSTSESATFSALANPLFGAQRVMAEKGPAKLK
jgi:hypothetical protein